MTRFLRLWIDETLIHKLMKIFQPRIDVGGEGFGLQILHKLFHESLAQNQALAQPILQIWVHLTNQVMDWSKIWIC